MNREDRDRRNDSDKVKQCKLLAKRIKKGARISHAKALDVAAKQFGYDSYHALHQASKRRIQPTLERKDERIPE